MPGLTEKAAWRMMWRSPWSVIALGFGSGLASFAPGTFGTLWAWASWGFLEKWLGGPVMSGTGGLVCVLLATGLGWVAIQKTAQRLGATDPGCIVVDEIAAFWLVLWVASASWAWSLVAFVLFRYFDAAKPGPVGWADANIGGALGVLVDDFVAAFLTLFALALIRGVVSGF